jgi:hypothetical protein
MALGVDLSILNQRGTPAFFSDIFANRPAFGFAGRVFISTDTGAIYEDTGTAWTLIADAGAGTTGTLQQVTTNGNTTTQGISITAGGLSANSITNTSLTTGSVAFVGAAGLMTQDNTNFFWDDTNNFLGIGNTGTPSAPLDIHNGTVGQLIQLNATSTNNSNIGFLNGGVGKWRIGNVYNAGANDFNLYNIGLAANAFSFLSATSAATFANNVTAKNLFFNTNTQTVKISNPVATGSFGSNIFIGNGGDSVTYTSADTGSYNTALGNVALNDITTGYRNAVIGNASMSGITTGYFNVAIGDNAGRFYGGIAALNTTNNTSIFIGRNSQASANGNTNEIVIGNELIGNGSNSITLGNSSITKTILAGSVLIGTTSTQLYSKLVIAGAICYNNNADDAVPDNGYGMSFSAKLNITGNSGANTIYSSAGSEGALYLISAINTTTNDRFVDLVIYLGSGGTAPVVVSSQQSGTPVVRAYTNVAETLKLAITGTANTYTIRMTALGANEKS